MPLEPHRQEPAALRRPRFALLALFLAGLGLRTQLIGVGPLLPEITAELRISHVMAGLMTTVPIVIMGLVAIPAAGLASRLGARRVVALGLALLALGGIVRPFAQEAAGVLAATVPIGIGMGVVGVVLPVVVKQNFPHFPATATGIYVTATVLGSSFAGTLAVPIATLGSGWRDPLLVFGAVGIITFAAWIVLTDQHASPAGPRPPTISLQWSRPAVWLLVGLFCLQALLFFGLVTWLAPALVEQGWGDAEAGGLVGLLIGSALPGTLLASWAGDRIGSRRLNLAAMCAVSVVSVTGLAGVPELGWLWAAGGGIALGAIFALVMTLPLDAAGQPEQAGGIAAMMLAGGYVFSGVAPTLLGAVRDATGSFSMSMWLLVATCVVLFLASLLVTRERLQSPDPVRRTSLVDETPAGLV